MDDRPTHPGDPSHPFPLAARSLPEARDRGRSLRGTLPRRSHGAFVPTGRDAVAILESQHASRLPALVPIRIGRMLQSPFSYYRGTAAVMAHDLATEVRTGIGLVVCGDAHVSNFGLFGSPERRVLFDLNDFDEATFGPWEWDVKRLAASALIGGRQLGLTAARCTEAATATVRGYREALSQLFALTALERFYFQVKTGWLEQRAGEDSQQIVRKTVRQARRRTSERVLSKITTVEDHGTRRIIDEFPIIRHDDDVTVEQIADLYDAYRLTVRTDVRVLLQQFRVVDTVLRIVGVGSVGTRCYIALLLGPSDEALFLQMKEAPPSVLATYGGLDQRSDSEGWRVVAGQRILQAASDPFLGWLTLGGRDYYCRQFRDKKGSFELEALSPSQFCDYSRLCGSVLARAHAQSPDAGIVSGYLGASPRFDEAIATWAHGYADQVERDHATLEDAVRTGRLPAELGV